MTNTDNTEGSILDNEGTLPDGTAPVSDFRDFGLNDTVLQGVDDAGFKVPSPIQMQAIPVIMKGRDVIGQAHTGTGKTAAFGLPALNGLRNSGKVEVLVITPTRELATQVSEEVFRLGKFLNVKSIAVYGGQPYGRQLDSIRRGAQVVVATPGRMLDLLQGGRLNDSFQPWLVVLDEADEMLDMGFIEDVQKILEFLPAERQTLLFSATMPRPIQLLAEKFMKDPAVVRIDHREPTSRDIQQQYYIIDEHERDDATMRLIDSLEPSRAMIFCRTKSEVDRLAGILAARGVPAQSFHGDMEQAMRERVLNGFRKGELVVLVATDVAARGIDVADVSHVFNYHIPFDPDSYVHRVGRTGRAGRTGVAITLVTPKEYHGLRRIQSKVGLMQQSFVPTHTDLKRANESKLLEAIRMQPVDPDAEQFIAAIEEELGLAQAANKMAALLMARDGISGPDKIGVSGTRLERLQEPRAPGTGKFKKRFERGHSDRSSRPYKGSRPEFKRSSEDRESRPAFKKYGNKHSGDRTKPPLKQYSDDTRKAPYKKRDDDRPQSAFDGFKKKKFSKRPEGDYKPAFPGAEKKFKSYSDGPKPTYKKRLEEGFKPTFKKRGDNFGKPGFKKSFGEGSKPPYKKRFDDGAKPGYKKRADEDFRPAFKKPGDEFAKSGFKKPFGGRPKPSFKKPFEAGPKPVAKRDAGHDSPYAPFKKKFKKH